MTLEALWAQTLFALLGGIAAELLHWYVLSRKPAGVRDFANHPFYWATTLGMIILGGIMPLLYIEGSASALLCFHLGAATPVIVQKLVANLPAAVAFQGSTGPSMRDFFTW